MRIISGNKRGAKLVTLEGEQTRPTLDRVRENIFNILQNDIHDASVLDLFAGNGALGCEAISRGATNVVFNDINYQAVDIIKSNLKNLGFNQHAKIFSLDWREMTKKLLQDEVKFDIVLLDAPYENDYILECIEICKKLLAQDGKIVVEHNSSVDITQASRQKKYGKVRVSIFE